MHLIRRAVFAGVTLVVTGGIAHARLASAPDKGVVLEGTWSLDAPKSDDSQAIVGQARENASDKHGGSKGESMNGFPGGGRHGGGMGGGRHGHQRPQSDAGDGDNASQSATADHHGGPHADILTELEKNPATLSFTHHDDSWMVATEAAAVDCEPGSKAALEDELGDAERVCGWDGRAWIVETNRGRAGTRSDRYEMSKDGKSLSYVSMVSGGRFPKVKITRIYRLTAGVPSAPGVPGSGP